MDLQTVLENSAKAARQEEMKTSPQLTLGELILKIAVLIPAQEAVKKKYDHEAKVGYDFEYLFPTDIASYRGIYAELALNFKSQEYGEKAVDPMAVTAFLEMLKGCIGKTFEGYKGGDFMMGKNTPIWVANYGNSGRTAVVDVLDEEHSVTLITRYLSD